MSNEMQVFDFNNNDVRVIPEGDRLWFVAQDICKCLGYSRAAQGLRHVPDEYVGFLPVLTTGGWQRMLSVDRIGMYWLVMRSNKPQARPFIDWVTSEIEGDRV